MAQSYQTQAVRALACATLATQDLKVDTTCVELATLPDPPKVWRRECDAQGWETWALKTHEDTPIQAQTTVPLSPQNGVPLHYRVQPGELRSNCQSAQWLPHIPPTTVSTWRIWMLKPVSTYGLIQTQHQRMTVAVATQPTDCLQHTVQTNDACKPCKHACHPEVQPKSIGLQSNMGT